MYFTTISKKHVQVCFRYAGLKQSERPGTPHTSRLLCSQGTISRGHCQPDPDPRLWSHSTLLSARTPFHKHSLGGSVWWHDIFISVFLPLFKFFSEPHEPTPQLKKSRTGDLRQACLPLPLAQSAASDLVDRARPVPLSSPPASHRPSARRCCLHGQRQTASTLLPFAVFTPGCV